MVFILPMDEALATVAIDFSDAMRLRRSGFRRGKNRRLINGTE